jgi:hypothetical protein
MSLRTLRMHIHPRAAVMARGVGKPPRASDVILGMTLVLLSVGLAALVLTNLFAAA